MFLSRVFCVLAALACVSAARETCVVPAGGSNATDDAPAIVHAFKKCGRGGKVVFKPTTYHIGSVMNITWLEDVDIDLGGTLLNQSTAFILGGNNVRIDGHGIGTLDGNGDTWYQWIKEQPNTSNYPGRPHAITFNGLTNSVVRGLSHHVEFDSILVNNTGNVVSSYTIRSSHITFNNWTVYNGDDSISLKGNSTDITITNSNLYNGLGIALGSIGQYKDQFETIERLKVSNVNFHSTLHANGYPPNGGGGGLGCKFAFREHTYTHYILSNRKANCINYVDISDVTAKDLKDTSLRGAAFAISQCTRFSGAPGEGNCTNSEFQVRDISVLNLSGTTESNRVASLQCSAVAPCTDIALSGINLELKNGTAASEYLCGNVENQKGFECTGAVCEGGSATGEC
ncbi:unnamed protein product [Aspergillus oryzae]|nr:unnamed protein product [Aspergillus oryzae]GMF92629.1 unnamed protein product [Aspergillus oryzae]